MWKADEPQTRKGTQASSGSAQRRGRPPKRQERDGANIVSMWGRAEAPHTEAEVLASFGLTDREPNPRDSRLAQGFAWSEFALDAPADLYRRHGVRRSATCCSPSG